MEALIAAVVGAAVKMERRDQAHPSTSTKSESVTRDDGENSETNHNQAMRMRMKMVPTTVTVIVRPRVPPKEAIPILLPMMRLMIKEYGGVESSSDLMLSLRLLVYKGANVNMVVTD